MSLRFGDVRSRVERLPFLQHRFDVGTRLRHRQRPLQPAHEIQEMAAAVAWIRRIKRQRQPHLDLLIVHVVAGRHDGDDPRRHAVDRNHPAEHRLVAAERAFPDFARERGNVLGARQRVGARELAAAQRRDPQHRHQLRGDHRRHDPARLILLPRLTAPARYAPTSSKTWLRSRNSTNSGADTQN